MLEDAPAYSRYHSMQVRDAEELLSRIEPVLRWSREGDEIVMDVGCGTGDNTVRVLLPSLPSLSVERVVAVDVLPSMVEFARALRPHPKIEYHVADIESGETLSRWNGKISKMFSIYCFNWVRDQRKAFENVHRLLREDGEFATVFALSANFWDCLPEIKESAKWKTYLENANSGIPESHYQKYGNSFYKDLLRDVGFDVLICEVHEKKFAYANDTEAREAFGSRCAYTSYVPEDLRENFKDDVFDAAARRLGRDEDGRITLRYEALTLHLSKKT